TIAARYTPAFGRPVEAGRRAGRGEKLRKAGSYRGRLLERESCPRVAGRVKRNGAARHRAPAGALTSVEICIMCTILATYCTLPEWVVAECKLIFAFFARIQ